MLFRSPATSVPELISLAQSSREPLTFASLGVNNTTHLAGELFNAMAGTRLVHVPYNGSPPAYQDMLAGRVPLGFVTLQSALPHLKSGRLKLIGLVASRRNRSYPDLPVIGETLKGYQVDSFMGFVAPAAVPREIQAKMAGDLIRVLKSDDVQAKLVEFGVEPLAYSPEAFATYLREEIAKWGPVVRAAGLKPE